MTSQQGSKWAMIGMMIFLWSIVTAFVAGIVYVGVAGIWWSATGDQRCVTSWDTRFQPQFIAGQCSIMQRGYRVPAPDYINPQNISSPDARDY